MHCKLAILGVVHKCCLFAVWEYKEVRGADLSGHTTKKWNLHSLVCSMGYRDFGFKKCWLPFQSGAVLHSRIDIRGHWRSESDPYHPGVV